MPSLMSQNNENEVPQHAQNVRPAKVSRKVNTPHSFLLYSLDIHAFPSIQYNRNKIVCKRQPTDACG